MTEADPDSTTKDNTCLDDDDAAAAAAAADADGGNCVAGCERYYIASCARYCSEAWPDRKSVV